MDGYLNELYGNPKPLKLRNVFTEVEKLYKEFDNNDLYHKSGESYISRIENFRKAKGLPDSMSLDLLDFALSIQHAGANFNEYN